MAWMLSLTLMVEYIDKWDFFMVLSATKLQGVLWLQCSVADRAEKKGLTGDWAELQRPLLWL